MLPHVLLAQAREGLVGSRDTSLLTACRHIDGFVAKLYSGSNEADTTFGAGWRTGHSKRS